MNSKNTFTRRQSAILAIAAALPAALLTRQTASAEDTLPDDVVVELSNPVLQNGDLSYDIKVLEGTIPKTAGECSLFIDLIGRPLTPASYAGVARRTTRRVVRRY